MLHHVPGEDQVGNALSDVEERVDDPVGEPLGVVVRGRRVDRLERHVRRVDEAHEGHDELRAADHEEQDAREHGAGHKDVELIHARLLLDLHDFVVAFQALADVVLVLVHLVHDGGWWMLLCCCWVAAVEELVLVGKSGNDGKTPPRQSPEKLFWLGRERNALISPRM